jgi:hypothetical protein
VERLALAVELVILLVKILAVGIVVVVVMLAWRGEMV